MWPLNTEMRVFMENTAKEARKAASRTARCGVLSEAAGSSTLLFGSLHWKADNLFAPLMSRLFLRGAEAALGAPLSSKASLSAADTLFVEVRGSRLSPEQSRAWGRPGPVFNLLIYPQLTVSFDDTRKKILKKDMEFIEKLKKSLICFGPVVFVNQSCNPPPPPPKGAAIKL